MSARAVLITPDGQCEGVDVRRTGTGGWVYKNRTRLYVQHADRHNHIVMLSPTKPEEIRSPNTALFLHPLPPPLNTHIYPATLIAARVDDQDSPVPFTPTMLHELCADLVATAQRASAETTQAIYDVPAIPLIAVDDEVESVFDDEEPANDFDEYDEEDVEIDEDGEEEEAWEEEECAS